MQPTTIPPPGDLPDQPDVMHLVTEDDTPVDNIPSAKQQRLLVEPLYSSWEGPGAGRPFLADANIGLYYSDREPPLVPDFLLSLDVEVAADWWQKQHRSYMMWVLGKAPDVAGEIVSNREGGEADVKFEIYRKIGIPYYVIYDPLDYLGGGPLRVFALHGRTYQPCDARWLPDMRLGLTLWEGEFEKKDAVWLRWCDRHGVVLPTGAERALAADHNIQREKQRAEQEKQRAEQEKQRADQEKRRADQEKQRAERLAEKLRKMGLDPEA